MALATCVLNRQYVMEHCTYLFDHTTIIMSTFYGQIGQLEIEKMVLKQQFAGKCYLEDVCAMSNKGYLQGQIQGAPGARPPDHQQ